MSHLKIYWNIMSQSIPVLIKSPHIAKLIQHVRKINFKSWSTGSLVGDNHFTKHILEVRTPLGSGYGHQ